MSKRYGKETLVQTTMHMHRGGVNLESQLTFPCETPSADDEQSLQEMPRKARQQLGNIRFHVKSFLCCTYDVW